MRISPESQQINNSQIIFIDIQKFNLSCSSTLFLTPIIIARQHRSNNTLAHNEIHLDIYFDFYTHLHCDCQVKDSFIYTICHLLFHKILYTYIFIL